MLSVEFGESAMSRTKLQLGYKRFKEDREDVNDDVRHCHPGTSTTDKNIALYISQQSIWHNKA